jgi:ADP-ribosylglycohydrolase
MIGAIAGDIIGSVYEFHPIKTKDFPLFDARCRFTDDSVLTIAVADAILENGSYLESIHDWGKRYPDAGYGGNFFSWLFHGPQEPYNSWGNGSAMRVCPVGFAFDTMDDVLAQAAASAMISHDHPEGIRDAQATALAVFLARTTQDKTAIKKEISALFGYDLDRTVDDIRRYYSFDVSCQGTVPEAVIAFLESDSYEDAIRNAISLGGDSDTLACITGGIAEAFYGGIPEEIQNAAREYLTSEQLEIVDAFSWEYGLE